METANTLETAKQRFIKTGMDVHIPTGMLLAGYGVTYVDTTGYQGMQSRTFTRYADAMDHYRDFAANSDRYPYLTLFGVPIPNDCENPHHFGYLSVSGLPLTGNGDDVLTHKAGMVAWQIPAYGTHFAQLLGHIERKPDDSAYPIVRALLSNAFSEIAVTFETVLPSGFASRDTRYMTYRTSTDVHAKRANMIEIDRETGLLSFLPASKYAECLDAGTLWSTSYRQTAKPAKVARMLMRAGIAEQFTDAQWERFTNIVKVAAKPANGTFEVVSGPDIQTAYHEANYAPMNIGTLASSCMRYDECQSYFGIYTDNPDRVSLLVYRDEENRVLGRALLWRTDGGVTVMDRVYGNDETQERFMKYANEHGYESRTGAIVSLRYADQEYYPYMDTFRYLWVSDTDRSGVLAVYETDLPEPRYRTLGDTSGGYEETDDRATCYECGERLPDDETYNTDNGYTLCETCYAEHVCQHCDHYSWRVNDGICSDCLAERTCSDCGATVDDPYDLTHGYCAECVDGRICGDCETVVDDASGLNDAGLCIECANRLCVRCGVRMSLADVNTARWSDPDRYRECCECQRRQPVLFPLHTIGYAVSRSYPHVTPRQMRYGYAPHRTYVPATGYPSIVDAIETEREFGY